MKIEKSTNYLRAGAIVVLLFGILLGLLLIVMPVESLLKIVFVVIGIMTFFYQIPSLALGLTHFDTGAGKLAVVLSLISMAFGVSMIFFHSTVLMLVLGVYLVVLPALQIIFSKNRALQWKAELPKIILGIVLLIVGPASALSFLFDVAGWVIIALSVVYTLASFLIRVGKRAKYENKTGNRIFVDVTGDGKVDTVYVDTTGDGTPDTARRYRDDK